MCGEMERINIVLNRYHVHVQAQHLDALIFINVVMLHTCLDNHLIYDCDGTKQSSINPSHSEFISGHKNIFIFVIIFHTIEMPQAVQILLFLTTVIRLFCKIITMVTICLVTQGARVSWVTLLGWFTGNIHIPVSTPKELINVFH